MAIMVPERETITFPSITYEPSVKDKLREAADLLEEKGWIQGRPFDQDGQHCTIGAIMEVCGLYRQFSATGQALYQQTVQSLQECLGTPIILWNDRPDQYKEHVIGTLRECAARME